MEQPITETGGTRPSDLFDPEALHLEGRARTKTTRLACGLCLRNC